MDSTNDIHGRARKKQQLQAQGDEASSSDTEGNNQQIGVGGGLPKTDGVNTNSSLFGQNDDEEAKEEDMGMNVNSDANFNTKAAAEQGKDDSDSSLFSSASESVKVMAIVKPTMPSSPPPNIEINKMNPSPSLSGVTGHEDSDCSLFSHDDQPEDKSNEVQTELVDEGAASIPYQKKTPPKPVYLTFDRPKCPDAESDIESSDDGSLFSLNERNDSTPSAPWITKTAKKTSAVAKSNDGLPSIPRKKSPKPKFSHAQSSASAKKGATSRPCHKFNRLQCRESLSGQSPAPEVKKKASTKGRVSFAATVKQPKKFVGKAARALKIAPLPEDSGTAAGKTTPTKQDTGEEGIYYEWQKSAKEKLWNKEFVRIKKYIREHGNNDVPEGHSLSTWIRSQQKQCQKWISNFFNDVKESDKEFQTFVHIYRLQRIGFEFGPRIDHAIESSIKNALQTLDEKMQKVMQSYGDITSPMHAKKPKREAVERAVDADEDFEFDDTVIEMKQPKHRPLKKMYHESDSVYGTMHKRKKVKHKAIDVPSASSNGFIDERPKKISWNGRIKHQHADMCQFQLPAAAQKRALELYKERLNDTMSTCNNVMRGCWYDLEHVALKQSNVVAIEENAVPTDPPAKSKPKKRLWSEVENLWSSGVEFAQPKAITSHELVDAAPISIAKDTMVVTEDSKATKPIPSPKKTAEISPSTKSLHETIPASTPTEDKKRDAALRSDDIAMRPSEDFPGWFVRYVPRKSGAGDYYYYSPCQKFKFRSRPEVRRFIEILERTGNEKDAMSAFKSSLKKPVMATDITGGRKPSEMPAQVTDSASKVTSVGNACNKAKPHINGNSPLNIQKTVKTADNASGKKSSKKPAQVTAVNASTERSDGNACNKAMPHKNVILRQGDEVYAPWRRNKNQKSPAFYSGVVVSTKVGYGGCSRVYNVRFDDGDELNNIDETLVIPKDEYIKNSFKHIYSCGDKIYSAWWPEKKRKAAPAWYPGIVKGVRVQGFGSKYGPCILYDVLFDDGDEHFNVEDHFVFILSDYNFSTKQLAVDKSEWIGVRNVVDNTSTDPWAKVVGWYAAKIDGVEQTYPLLTDALRAYDTHTVYTLGIQTQKNDLNIPHEWAFTKARAPIRREEVAQIAGRKLVPTEAPQHSGPRALTKTETTSRTVKQQDHILKWNSVKSDTKLNANKFDSSDCESDDSGNVHDSMTASMSKKKPEFKKGENVYALLPSENKWQRGRIWEIKIKPNSDNGYGPERSFDIIYDDGKKDTGVKEVHVMKTLDYEVCMLKGENDWIGVKTVTDPDSRDEFARSVGWYKVSLEGSNESFIFASLQEALRYYDKLLIMRKGTGAKISAAELNFPAELKGYC